MPAIEGPLFVSAAAFKAISVSFGSWLKINIEAPSIEVEEGLSLDAATRRFLNACADQLGAKRPCEGPGLWDQGR